MSLDGIKKIHGLMDDVGFFFFFFDKEEYLCELEYLFKFNHIKQVNLRIQLLVPQPLYTNKS